MTQAEGGDATLVGRAMQAIRQRIAGRSLGPGAKLPSIRSFAETMGVSKSTIVEAYDRLAADGTVQARRGSGFYVAGHAPPLALAEIEPNLDRAIDPLWVYRTSLQMRNEVLKPGCGWLPASWMPDEGLRRALRSVSHADNAVLADYQTPLGLPPLRELIARRLGERGIGAAPDQIILTDSGTHAVDLLCRFLLEPGDVVVVDDPCYFNFRVLLTAHRVKIVGVPFTRTGPDLEAFERVLEAHKPRLYITNSALHNPTGATLSPVVAHRLLKLADRFDLTILEDDVFADFEHEPASRLAAFDGLARVVHTGSFSKTLSAAVRCGFIAARHDWIEPMADLKIATTIGSSRLSAEIVLRVLKDGSYRRHVEALRTRLAHTMGATIARLRDVGLTPWIVPNAGMFLWCELPDGLDASDLTHRAAAEDIVLAPGNVFSLSQSAGRFLRFNVAQTSDPRIFSFLEAAIR